MNSTVGDRYIAELVQIFEQQGRLCSWEHRTVATDVSPALALRCCADDCSPHID